MSERLFHIRPDGKVDKCKSKKGKCPYGKGTRHFYTKRDTTELADKINKINSEGGFIFASSNQGKIKEIQEILGIDLKVYSKDEIGLKDFDTIEDKDTILGNAQKKARELWNMNKGIVFADDSGLFVESLNNEPGVFSARYAGDHNDNANINKVLENMKDKKDRKAYFQTTIVIKFEDGTEESFDGFLYGSITKERKGTNGFGYDSIFVPDGYTKTLAEMSQDEKNNLSHRRIALDGLKTFIKNRNKEVL